MPPLIRRNSDDGQAARSLFRSSSPGACWAVAAATALVIFGSWLGGGLQAPLLLLAPVVPVFARRTCSATVAALATALLMACGVAFLWLSGESADPPAIFRLVVLLVALATAYLGARFSLASSSGERRPAPAATNVETSHRRKRPISRPLPLDPLARLARFDVETGLATRYVFDDRLAGALARASRFGRRMAVMVLDPLATTEPAADSGPGLAAVAERLMGQIRKIDTLARLDEHRLGVIKTDFDTPEHAALLAESLQEVLAEPVQVGARIMQPSKAIGIALFPPGEDDPRQLVKQADLAQVRAREGEGGYQFYDQDIGREVERRLLLARELAGAVEHGELLLEYQPQIDLTERQVVGVEALLRWRHPRRGLLDPAQFLAVAEASGQMPEIGDWGIDAACREARELQGDRLPPVPLAINVSAAQLRHADFLANVERALQRSGIRAGALELELTEASVMQAPHVVAKIFARLHDLGVRIAIDDFGTSYCSIEHLRRFHIDKLKIDPSFIVRIEQDASDAAIVAGILALGRKLGLQVVAEGVESEGQVEFLVAEGCAEAQGFYFSPPLSATELRRLLDSGNGEIEPRRISARFA